MRTMMLAAALLATAAGAAEPAGQVPPGQTPAAGAAKPAGQVPPGQTPAAGAAEPAEQAPQGQTPHGAYRAGDYAFQMFVPQGYSEDRNVRWPLMIFLHGSGECGSDLSVVAKWGPPAVVAKHPGAPMLIASPQLPEGDWDLAKLDRLLADVRRTYRVDPARIYLTGLSLGGTATWRWAIAHPELFAAIAPVAAVAPTEGACHLKDLPIWAFHGDRDLVAPVRGDFELVEAVRGCFGSVAPRLTVYADTDHFAWVPAYDDPAFWRWIGEQHRPMSR